MRAIHNKWFGTCNICGARMVKLMTTKTSKDSMTYWIKRACQHCHDVIQNDINHAILSLRADQRMFTMRKEHDVTMS